MSQKSSLALIVPCYNESESIPLFEKELIVFKNDFNIAFPGWEFTVFVVDNISTDNSFELLKLIEKQLSFVKVIQCQDRGYGSALKHGFRVAQADYYAFLDLDNTYPLVSLIAMQTKILNDKLDIIFGARISELSGMPFVRYIGNQSYVWLMSLLFNSPLSDVCTGMRLFKSDIKKDILNIKTDGLSFSIDFTSMVFIKKWKVDEISIQYRERMGESKLSVLSDGFRFLFVVLINYIKKQF